MNELSTSSLVVSQRGHGEQGKKTIAQKVVCYQERKMQLPIQLQRNYSFFELLIDGMARINCEQAIVLAQKMPSSAQRMFQQLDAMLSDVSPEESSDLIEGPSHLGAQCSDILAQLFDGAVKTRDLQLAHAGVSSMEEFHHKTRMFQERKLLAEYAYLSDPANILRKKMIDEQLVLSSGQTSDSNSATIEGFWNTVSLRPNAYSQMKEIEKQSSDGFMSAIMAQADSLMDTARDAAMSGKEFNVVNIIQNLFTGAMQKVAENLQHAQKVDSVKNGTLYDYVRLKGLIEMPVILKIITQARFTALGPFGAAALLQFTHFERQVMELQKLTPSNLDAAITGNTAALTLDLDPNLGMDLASPNAQSALVGSIALEDDRQLAILARKPGGLEIPVEVEE